MILSLVFCMLVVTLPVPALAASSVLPNRYVIVAVGQNDTAAEDAARTYSCKGKTQQECIDQNPISYWIRTAVNVLVVISLVGAVFMVVLAGLEYITSDGSPEKTKSARDKIFNVVIGLLVLAFMYAFLQWLIPGGAFNG